MASFPVPPRPSLSLPVLPVLAVCASAGGDSYGVNPQKSSLMAGDEVCGEIASGMRISSPQPVAESIVEDGDFRMLVYEEYLKSPQWRDVRAQVIARAGGRCQINADHDGPLHVHHRSYEAVFGGDDQEMNDCIAVCAWCHAN